MGFILKATWLVLALSVVGDGVRRMRVAAPLASPRRWRAVCCSSGYGSSSTAEHRRAKRSVRPRRQGELALAEYGQPAHALRNARVEGAAVDIAPGGLLDVPHG